MKIAFKIFIIIFLTLLTYSKAPFNDYVWDDDVYLTDAHLTTVDGLKNIWLQPTITEHPYYPLTHSSFWLENYFFDHTPFYSHLINILIHSISAILLYLILLHLNIHGAWVCAALFTVHPVYVESVAWVAERKNVLSAVFLLASLLSYLKAYATNFCNLQKKKYYFLSLLLFILCLFSKTAFCTFPIALLGILWWKKEKIKFKDCLLLAPYFLISLVLGLFTIWMEKNHVGAQGADWDLSWIQRCLIASKALWFYGGKILFPYPISFVYTKWNVDVADFRGYLFILATAAVISWFFWKRNKLGKGPIVAILFFIVLLLPALGFINFYLMRYTFVADHLQYVASIGVLVGLISFIYQYITKRFNLEARIVVFSFLITSFSFLSWQQTLVYKNNLVLFTDVLKKNPECWMAYNNRGIEYKKRKQLKEAIGDYDNAIRLKLDHARAYNNRANAFAALKQYKKAVTDYSLAIKLDPDYESAYMNRANTFALLNNFEQALKDYQSSLKLNSKDATIYYNRAKIYHHLNKHAEALKDANMAASLGHNKAKQWLHQNNQL